MFVAIPSASVSRVVPCVAVAPATPWLIAWVATGVLALLLIGAARGGDAAFGATLPFWLVGAPLVDLLWVERLRLRMWLSRRLTRARITRTSRNRVRRSARVRFS